MLHSFLSDTWARPTACLFLEPTAQCPWFSCRQAAVRYASAALRNKLPTVTDSHHLPQTNREQSAGPLSDRWTHTGLGTDPGQLSNTCSWKRRKNTAECLQCVKGFLKLCGYGLDYFLTQKFLVIVDISEPDWFVHFISWFFSLYSLAILKAYTLLVVIGCTYVCSNLFIIDHFLEICNDLVL